MDHYIQEIFVSVDGVTDFNEFYTAIRGYIRAPKLETLQMPDNAITTIMADATSRGYQAFFELTATNIQYIFKTKNECGIQVYLSIREGKIMDIQLSVPYALHWFSKDILLIVPEHQQRSFYYKEIVLTENGIAMQTKMLWNSPCAM